MAVLILALLLVAPSLSLKALASRDHIRLTAYVPQVHDEILGWVECPGGYRSSYYQRERRQHTFEWRFKGCPVFNDGPCMCEAGIRVSLRGEIVAHSTTPLLVPF